MDYPSIPWYDQYSKYIMSSLSDTDTASKALKLVNGYLLKDKPVIILYGRQNSGTKNEERTKKEGLKGKLISQEKSWGKKKLQETKNTQFFSV